MAKGRDTARYILGLGQAAIGISLARNFHDLLVVWHGSPRKCAASSAPKSCGNVDTKVTAG